MEEKGTVFEVVGNNTFKDKSGRILIHDPKKQIAYIVTKQEKNQYKLYTGKWLYAAMIAIVVGGNLNWIVGLVLAAIVVIGLECLYRFKFLPSLRTIDSRSFPKASNMYERNLLCPYKTNGFKAVVSFVALFAIGYLFKKYVDLNTIFVVRDERDIVMFLLLFVVLFYDIAILVSASWACITQYQVGER